jgi:hypothetical protein
VYGKVLLIGFGGILDWYDEGRERGKMLPVAGEGSGFVAVVSFAAYAVMSCFCTCLGALGASLLSPCSDLRFCAMAEVQEANRASTTSWPDSYRGAAPTTTQGNGDQGPQPHQHGISQGEYITAYLVLSYSMTVADYGIVYCFQGSLY